MNLAAVLAAAALVASAATPARSQQGRIVIGAPLPDERFSALSDGRPVSLTELRGKRVLLLVFASW